MRLITICLWYNPLHILHGEVPIKWKLPQSRRELVIKDPINSITTRSSTNFKLHLILRTAQNNNQIDSKSIKKKHWYEVYPPSRCSLNILSNARQSSRMRYNWACKRIAMMSLCPFNSNALQLKISVKITPESEAIGLPRWSISDSSSSIVLFIREVMLGKRDLIAASRCWKIEAALHHLPFLDH